MEKLLGKACTSDVFVSGLPVDEAISLLSTCRQSKRVMAPYLVPLGFAKSRPQLLVDGGPLTVGTWTRCWQECAASVCRSGLDPGHWADSSYAEVMGSRAKIPHNHGCLVRMMRAAKKPANLSAGIRVSGVLMVEAEVAKDDSVLSRNDLDGCVQSVSALVILSNGDFAWLGFEYTVFQSIMGLINDGLGQIALRVSNSLASLVEDVNIIWSSPYNGCLRGQATNRFFEFFDDSEASPWMCNLEDFPHENQSTGSDGIYRLLQRGLSPCREGEISCARGGMQDANPSVIQEIEHSDPAAVRDVESAAIMVQAQQDEDFAEVVQKNIQVAETTMTNDVFICSFRSGKGEVFRKMLLEDMEFKQLRQRILEAGYRPVLKPSNAIILVRPDQYADTIAALGARKLKRYNVVIAASEEYLMDEVLARLKYKERPRENRKERAILDVSLEFIEARTFLCEAPKLWPSGTVAQSTTDAVLSDAASSSNYLAHVRGPNPRRALV